MKRETKKGKLGISPFGVCVCVTDFENDAIYG